MARRRRRRTDARYGFVLDEDPKVLPDPRSPRQPDGVHERSQLWSRRPRVVRRRLAGRSIEGAVIYELHIGTFTPGGTFDSAIEKLDYLVDLGVDFVELMPVNAFGGTHGWGYDGVLWYAVHEPYGGPDGLVRFVDACHARGLGVLIDAVFNHLGPSGNYLPRFGPYLSSGSNPWGESINIADAAPTRCAATSSTARCAGCATSTPTDFGWTPCTPWSTPPRCTSSRNSPPKPMRWQRTRPTAVADRRERPQRSAPDHPARPGRLWHDRTVGRRHPPCDPHRGVR